MEATKAKNRDIRTGEEALAELDREAEAIRARTDRPIAELTDEELAWDKLGHTSVSSLELSRRSYPDPEWIVPNIIPEGVTVLAGKPKIGKSWLALAIAGAVSVGTKVLGEIPVTRRKVLYLALEDTDRRLSRRQAKLGVLPSDNLRFITRWKPEDDIAAFLCRLCETIPDIGLVIIDPLAYVRPVDEFQVSPYMADYRIVGKIKDVADHYHIAIIILHHVRKATAEDALELVSGTFGVTGAADTILVLKRNRGEGEAELCVMGRDVEESELALRQDPDCGWVLLGDAKVHRQSRQRRQLLEALDENGDEMRVKDIAAAAEVDYKAASKLLAKLAKEGLVKKGPYGKYLSLSK